MTTNETKQQCYRCWVWSTEDKMKLVDLPVEGELFPVKRWACKDGNCSRIKCRVSYSSVFASRFTWIDQALSGQWHLVNHPSEEES